MTSFAGEADRKSRFLRELYGNAGMTHISAVFAGISLLRDHERWMAEDAAYRGAFKFAKEEGERRLEQHLFNVICDAARNGDRESADWIQDTCGEETMDAAQKGERPKWKRA